jgi:hypothetical protein
MIDRPYDGIKYKVADVPTPPEREPWELLDTFSIFLNDLILCFAPGSMTTDQLRALSSEIETLFLERCEGGTNATD